jgi:hypothetical protein
MRWPAVVVVTASLLAGCGSSSHPKAANALTSATERHLDAICGKASRSGIAIMKADLRSPAESYHAKEVEAAAHAGLRDIAVTMVELRHVHDWNVGAGSRFVQHLELGAEMLRRLLVEIRASPGSALSGKEYESLSGYLALGCGPVQEGDLGG